MSNSETHILNPKTGRFVLKTGALGKKLLADQNGASKNAKTVKRSRSASPKKTVTKKTTLAKRATSTKRATSPKKVTSVKRATSPKSNDPKYIYNPETERWVLKSGAIGKKLMVQQNSKNLILTAIKKKSNKKLSSPKKLSPRKLPSPQKSPKKRSSPKKLTSPKKSPSLTTTATTGTLTGITDVDYQIIDDIDSLQTLVNLYNTDKYARGLLDKKQVYEKLKQKFNFDYFNNFNDVAKLGQQLEKTHPNTKIIYKKEVEDYKVGDRIVLLHHGNNKLNMVVTSVKGREIEFSPVDLFGNKISGSTQTGYLINRKRYPEGWYWQTSTEDIVFYNDRNTFFIKAGISLALTGPVVYNLDDIAFRYRTSGDETTPNLLVEIYNLSFPYSALYVIDKIYDDGSIHLHYVGPRKKDKALVDQTVTKGTASDGHIRWKNQDGKWLEIKFGAWTERDRRPY